PGSRPCAVHGSVDRHAVLVCRPRRRPRSVVSAVLSAADLSSQPVRLPASADHSGNRLAYPRSPHRRTTALLLAGTAPAHRQGQLTGEASLPCWLPGLFLD